MPQPGDFGVVATSRNAPWLDRVAARAIRFDTESPVNHAFIAVDDEVVVEAWPGGARYNLVSSYPDAIWSCLELDARQRDAIALAAVDLLGIGYGWLDLIAVGIAQKRWSPALRERWLDGQAPWWVWHVADSTRLICSQLVDLCYYAGGKHLFRDKRLPGLVAPSDLYQIILAEQWVAQ